MARRTSTNEPGLAEDYARWLESNRSEEELAGAAERIFRDSGPAMRERMRLDLAEFLRERSARELAQFISLNDDPLDDPAYLASLDEAERRRLGRLA